MNPKEQEMFDKISFDKEIAWNVPDLAKLAKVLVEMEERISTPWNEASRQVDRKEQDPYLTALDDVERRLNEKSLGSLVALVDDLRKKHKE